MAKRLRKQDVEERTIAKALSILEARLKVREVMSDVETVKNFLRLQAQGLEHEVFAVMYLDAKHRLIEYEQLFRGTLTRSSVYPRDIVKQALLKNAAAVILHHNHPSGDCGASAADEELTMRVEQALSIVDVRVLDHVITSDEGSLSMTSDQSR